MHLFLISPFASAMKIPGPVAFSFSGYDVYWAGILLAAGVILAILLAQYEVKRKKLPPDTAVDICLIGIPLGVLCARLFYVFTNLPLFKGDLVRILYFWDGGLSIYGAMIGVLIGIVIYSLAKKLLFLSLTDLLVPGLLLTQALALWGDFFEQRGFGPEIASSGLQWFPFAVLIEETDTIHAAVFFYEFIWCLLVFGAIWFFVRKMAKRDGAITLWYLLLYPAGHLSTTFLRLDGSYLFGGALAERLVCIALIVFALVLLIVRKQKPAPEAEAGEADVEASEASEAAETSGESEATDEAETTDEPEENGEPEAPAEPETTEPPEQEPAENEDGPSGKEA